MSYVEFIGNLIVANIAIIGLFCYFDSPGMEKRH